MNWDQYVSVENAAKMFKISTATIYRHINNGNIKKLADKTIAVHELREYLLELKRSKEEALNNRPEKIRMAGLDLLIQFNPTINSV